MNILKEYYSEQSASQPSSSLKIELISLKARQFTVRKFVFIAVITVLSLGFSTAVYAAVRQFVDRADVRSQPTFVAVEDESQAGWAHDAFSPVTPFDRLDNEEIEVSDDGLDPHRNLLIVETYEEAAALLGRDFIVPEIPGFYVDMFDFGPAGWERDHCTVTIVMLNDINHMFLYTVHREDSMFDLGEYEIRIVGTIEELYINNVKVYLITEQNEFGEFLTFLWEHNGLTYRIFGRNDLSEAEYLEIIASMIP